MRTRIKNKCNLCGKPSGSVLLCTECRMNFCRKCYAPKLIEKGKSSPVLIYSCPNCKGSGMRYID